MHELSSEYGMEDHRTSLLISGFITDREEFAVALTGTAPPRVRSPVGDLIGF